jgi:hypothetical protein
MLLCEHRHEKSPVTAGIEQWVREPHPDVRTGQDPVPVLRGDLVGVGALPGIRDHHPVGCKRNVPVGAVALPPFHGPIHHIRYQRGVGDRDEIHLPVQVGDLADGLDAPLPFKPHVDSWMLLFERGLDLLKRIDEASCEDNGERNSFLGALRAPCSARYHNGMPVPTRSLLSV